MEVRIEDKILNIDPQFRKQRPNAKESTEVMVGEDNMLVVTIFSVKL